MDCDKRLHFIITIMIKYDSILNVEIDTKLTR